MLFIWFACKIGLPKQRTKRKGLRQHFKCSPISLQNFQPGDPATNPQRFTRKQTKQKSKEKSKKVIEPWYLSNITFLEKGKRLMVEIMKIGHFVLQMWLEGELHQFYTSPDLL